MRMVREGIQVLAFCLLLGSGQARAEILVVPNQYPTIQEAVNAASPTGGDQILVAAGVYEEQVVISHDVAITGAGVGLTILRAPVYMDHVTRPPNNNPIIHAKSLLGQVVLRDMTIDGAGRGREGTRFTGILFERCGGLTERIVIENLYEETVTSINSGIGFYAYSETGDGLHLLVEDVIIRDYQKTGFVCFGAGCEIDLRNIECIPTPDNSQTVHNGFELLNGTFGTISNCIARNCYYDGTYFPYYISCAFLFYYAQHWQAVDCQSDQGQSGFYNLATNLVLEGTEITCCAQQLNYSYGVVTTGLSPALTLNSIFATPQPTISVEPGPISLDGKTSRLDGCRIVGAGVTGSLGVLAMSGLGTNYTQLENCDITQWDVGISTYESYGRVSSQTRTCRIQDNLTQAVLNLALEPFDARGNYWGDPSGPYNPSSNPDGLGDLVSDNVFFDPWLKGNLVCAPVPRYIALADADADGYAGDLTARYLGGEGEPVYGFSAEITWNQEKLGAVQADFSRPESGLFQAAVLFQVIPIADGFRVDAALGGDQPGILAGELFKVRFHLLGDPDYVEVPINLELRHLRDNQNREIEGTVTDNGLVIGDLMPPQFSALKLNNLSLPHTNEYVKNGDLVSIEAIVSDEDPLFGRTSFLGDFVYLFAHAGVDRLPDSYEDGTAFWFQTSAEMYPPDGLVSYLVSATDPAGNIAAVDSTVISDNTPPQPVSGLVAASGSDRVDLLWDEPAGLDANLRQVVIRSSRTGLYPYFDAPEPSYPVSPTAGDPVYTGLGNTATITFPDDGSERDILSFQAFAVDQVGFVTFDTGGSRDRAANYFLADVTAAGVPGYDHATDIYDVTWLGETFDLSSGEPGFNAECDVGPTDSGSSSGLPQPDGVVDLEDLMIFADRFDSFLHPTTSNGPAGSSPSVQLAWTRRTDGLWALELVEPCPELKAIQLSGNLPAGGTLAVNPGELLGRQDAPYFLHAAPEGLQVSVALLGRGVGFTGTGELLRVATSHPQESLSVALKARSVANTVLDASLSEELKPAPVPTVFALHGNYPNPFNPATTIAFDLPSPQQVKLTVFGLDGGRIRQLISERLTAGRHEVIWRGRDDNKRTVAAGTYLYRVQAGSWSATGKLNLVK